MRNKLTAKLTAITLLTVLIIGLSSCATSRSKYGCPATAASGRFRG